MLDGTPRAPHHHVMPTRLDRTNQQYPVWVLLEELCVRDHDMPQHVNGAGVDLCGRAPGTLSHWIPTTKGDWMGVVDFDVPYADGREPEHFTGQLVPGCALRERERGDA